MTKIVFDNSIHLGQFNIDNNSMRIAAKNSQIMISTKPIREVIGIESFNENSVSDDIIWGLEREPQDTFYKFMDNTTEEMSFKEPNLEDFYQETLKIFKKHDINLLSKF